MILLAFRRVRGLDDQLGGGLGLIGITGDPAEDLDLDLRLTGAGTLRP